MVNDTPLDELSENLLDFVLEIASGKKSKSEEAGFHDMAIFKQGVTFIKHKSNCGSSVAA